MKLILLMILILMFIISMKSQNNNPYYDKALIIDSTYLRNIKEEKINTDSIFKYEEIVALKFAKHMIINKMIKEKLLSQNSKYSNKEYDLFSSNLRLFITDNSIYNMLEYKDSILQKYNINFYYIGLLPYKYYGRHTLMMEFFPKQGYTIAVDRDSTIYPFVLKELFPFDSLIKYNLGPIDTKEKYIDSINLRKILIWEQAKE